MLIDGVFVPATSNRGVLSKQDTLPHLEVPPTVSPPSPSEALTSRATAEDILDAANAVAYLPPDSSLLPHTEMKMEQESVERARRLHDMQVRQSHADKLYSLMRVRVMPQLKIVIIQYLHTMSVPRTISFFSRPLHSGDSGTHCC